MMRHAAIATLACFFLIAVVTADETEQYNEIRQLLSKQQLDEAEQALQTALDANPESARLKSLHYLFYFYLNRADRPLDAARHAEANVEVWLGNLQRSPQVASSFAVQVNNVTSAYLRADKPAVALETLKEVIGKVTELQKAQDAPEFAALVTELRARKSLLLTEINRADEGAELLSQLLEETEKAMLAAPDDIATVLARAQVLQVAAEFEAEGEAGETAQQMHLSFLSGQAKTHSSVYPIVSAYYSAHLNAISSLTRSDAVKAEEQLQGVQEFFASLETDDRQVQSLIAGSDRSFKSLQQRIDAAKVQQALIGQPAFPLDADAWANGEPLTDQDLVGKVVLLDFWAVWCGPCIATFPHLREWHDKYSDQGLMIIGSTKYYSYDWDDETDRIKRVIGLSPEDEQAALVRFAQHHELEHRFMVTPQDSEFSKNYGVTGIPQAVLIDRNGIVRLIRVGSGDANAHDLEQLIEELIATPAAAAGGG